MVFRQELVEVAGSIPVRSIMRYITAFILFIASTGLLIWITTGPGAWVFLATYVIFAGFYGTIANLYMPEMQAKPLEKSNGWTTYDTSKGHCGLCGRLDCNGKCFK